MKESKIPDLKTALFLIEVFHQQRDNLAEFILELQNDIRKGLAINKKLDDFIENMPNILQSDVLKVGLHGRKTSLRLKTLLAREKITGRN
jgi:hypothetical protein